jgi:hypothetical protein
MIQYQTGLLSEAIAIACPLSLGSSHHDDQSTRARPQGTSPVYTSLITENVKFGPHNAWRNETAKTDKYSQYL